VERGLDRNMAAYGTGIFPPHMVPTMQIRDEM
jgi:hypothetical protein